MDRFLTILACVMTVTSVTTFGALGFLSGLRLAEPERWMLTVVRLIMFTVLTVVALGDLGVVPSLSRVADGWETTALICGGWLIGSILGSLARGCRET